jgi:hypothetical protein
MSDLTEKRRQLLQQQCGSDCCCKQEDAITTEITVKEME